MKNSPVGSFNSSPRGKIAFFLTFCIVAGWAGGVRPGLATAQEPKIITTTVTVSDMHCENCAKKIRNKLFTVPNVAKVTTVLSKHEVVIEPVAGKTVSAYAIWDALEAADFEPTKLVGPEGEFTKKPDAPQ